MIVVAAILAAFLCASLALASFLHVLYSESLRIRPREGARSWTFFDETLRPRLKLETEDGAQRFLAAKQLAVLRLALNLA